MLNFNFIQILKEQFVSKQCKTLSDAVFCGFDLFFHCLPMSHKKEARLKWVNYQFKYAKEPSLGEIRKLIVKYASVYNL